MQKINQIHNSLSNGYKKYKDDFIEEKNGYSLSFEDLEQYDNIDQDIEADICDMSDDWTPIGKINKKHKKPLTEKICIYFLWCSSIFGIMSLFYFTIIELYRE
jgi:hypothetical protein